MKKVLIVAAIAAAAGAGTYLFNEQQNKTPSYNVLDYVPADTPLFSGQLEPFPLKDYLSSAASMVNPADQQLLNELYDEKSPKLNFFLNIFKTYQEGLSNPELLIKTFGLPENLRAYFYTLGLLPVVKTEIDNPQAVWDLLDKNERETGFTHRKGTLQTINYRAYQLSAEDDPAEIELIVAIDKGLLTLTLYSAYNDQALLASALGLTKVENSLATSGKIDEIIKTHQFKKASISYFDHIELVKGLTTTDGNQLARQITDLEKQLNKESPLKAIRNSECATDFASIANNWPRSVAGYTDYAINAKESTLQMHSVIESKNQNILTALKTIRGYLPKYTADIKNNVFAMGLGIDVGQLANSFTDIWRDLQTPSYSCQPLAQLQTKISQSGQSISMLGMGASLVNGVQGLSVAVLDYTIAERNNQPSIENLDALVTLSAENPEQLFNSAKMFSPELQQIQLSDNGEEIDLKNVFPIPAQLNLAPKLAIKGKHLVIYNGEKGKKVADALTSEPLSQNGLYNISFDFKKIFTPLLSAVELSGETIPEDIRFLADYNARIKMDVDINQQGMLFDLYLNSKAEK